MSNSRTGYGTHPSVQPSHPPSRSQTHMRQMMSSRSNNMMANSSISTQVAHNPNSLPMPTISPNYYYLNSTMIPQAQYPPPLPGATNQAYSRSLLYLNYHSNVFMAYPMRNHSMSGPARANLATHGLPNSNEVPNYNNEPGQLHPPIAQLAGQTIPAPNFFVPPTPASSQLPQREKTRALLQHPDTLEYLDWNDNSNPNASSNQTKASNQVEDVTPMTPSSASEQPGNIACEEFVNKISAAAMTLKSINSSETKVISESSNVEDNKSVDDVESDVKNEISEKSAHVPESDINTLHSTVKESNASEQAQISINSSDDSFSSKKNNLTQELTKFENANSFELIETPSSNLVEGKNEEKAEVLKESELPKQEKEEDKINAKSDLIKLNSESTNSQKDISLQYSDAKNDRLKSNKRKNIEEVKTSNESSLISDKAILNDEINVSKNSNSSGLTLTLEEKSQNISTNFSEITSQSNEKLTNISKIDVSLKSKEDKEIRDVSEKDKDGTTKQIVEDVSCEKSEKQEKISYENVSLETKQNEENENSIEKNEDKDKAALSKVKLLTGVKANTKGKLEYEIEFLKSLKDHSESLKKPQLPSLDIVLNSPNVQKVNLNTQYNFLPQFVSCHQRPMMPRLCGRGSQGRLMSRNQLKIIPSPSLTQDVKLHTVENAWKPTLSNSKKESNQDLENSEAAKTEELLKRFRGILNKLTPQKYEKLILQIDQLTIDTEERSTKIIELIFDKAVEEPAFCVFYAQLCRYISKIKEKSGDGEEKVEIRDNNLRKLLLSRCQREFESDMYKEIDIETRLKEIEETEDLEKRKSLETELDEDKRKARKRQLGIIKFIGDLYTFNMIQPRIMIDCIKKLISERDEDSLECLCTLLRSIGGKLESTLCGRENPIDLTEYISTLEDIVNKRETTARVRFMIQDILDMRKDGWKFRKIQDENKPKTIDQIHHEAREEERKLYEIHQHMLKKQDSLIKKPHPRPEEWIPSARNSSSGTKMMDTFRILKDKTTISDNVQLGPSHFNEWGKGAQGGVQAQKPQGLELINRHSSHSEKDNRNLRQNTNSINRDKGRPNQPIALTQQMQQIRNLTPSQEKDYLNSYSGRISGGRMPPSSSSLSSSEIKNEVLSRNSSLEKSRTQSSRNNSVKLESPVKEVSKVKFKGKADLSQEDLEKNTLEMCKNFIQAKNYNEANKDVINLCNEQNVHNCVLAMINYALELSSQTDRLLIGTLLCYFVKNATVESEQFYKGLDQLLEAIDEISVDVPLIYEYMGEIFSSFFYQLENEFRRNFFIRCFSSCIEMNKAAKLMANVVNCASSLSSHSKSEVSRIWLLSKLKWSDFLPKDSNEQEFISQYKLGFTTTLKDTDEKQFAGENKLEDDSSLSESQELSERIRHLSKFILSKKPSPVPSMIEYIKERFNSDEFSNPQFFSALCNSIIRSCVSKDDKSSSYVTNLDRLKEYFAVLSSKFAQGDAECEIETLFSIQKLMEELQHPKNLMTNIFKELYESHVISRQAFKEWYKNDPNSKGKGVAVMETKQFMVWLDEEDVESDTN